MTNTDPIHVAWLDWCAATARDPLRADVSALGAFLAFRPCGPRLRDAWLARVVAAHRRAGREVSGLPEPDPRLPLWPDDDMLLDAGSALSRIPGWGLPYGPLARRDASVVAMAASGATRASIVAATRTDADRLVGAAPDDDDTARCCACAIARQAEAVDAAWDGRASVLQGLMAAPPARHACRRPLATPNPGVASAPLVHAFDGWGRAAVSQSLSTRAVTTIVNARRGPDAPTWSPTVARKPTPIPAGGLTAAKDALWSRLEDLDEHLDALAARLEEITAGLEDIDARRAGAGGTGASNVAHG